MFSKVGVSQSLYYVNNKVYMGLFSDIESVIEDSIKFYNEKKRRKIVIVTDTSDISATLQIKAAILQLLIPYQKDITAKDLSDDIFEIVNEGSTDIEFLESYGKKIILFTNPVSLCLVFTAYVKAQMEFIGQEDQTENFLNKVFQRDIELSSMTGVTYSIIKDIVSLATPPFKVDFSNATGKKWSFDILFFLFTTLDKDSSEFSTVKNMINIKFSIHRDVMIDELIQHMTRQYQFYAVIMNFIDYLVNEGTIAISKEDYVQAIFRNRNSVISLYMLKDLLDMVEASETMMDRIKNHENWEYLETYNEWKRTTTMSLELASGEFSDNIRAHWGEIEFLSKRRPRIPYLFFKVEPL